MAESGGGHPVQVGGMESCPFTEEAPLTLIPESPTVSAAFPGGAGKEMERIRTSNPWRDRAATSPRAVERSPSESLPMTSMRYRSPLSL